jgi:hypothetical protein
MESKLPYGVRPGAGESNEEYRNRVTRLQAEALERRQKELEEQASPQNDPPTRIRIWERIHEIELPRSPTHHLIGVIAADTGVSRNEVLAEQRKRASAPAGDSSESPFGLGPYGEAGEGSTEV